MAAATEYTKEQLNYYRICYVTTDILADGLRSIFKQEWDNRYKATMGEWKDEPRNGQDFSNGETPRNQRRNARNLATIVKGNRAEWDCTVLFYAILYSDCIHALNPVVQSNVDDLRKFRNEEFAHIRQGYLTDAEFQNAIGKVDVAFQALGLPTVKIQAIRNQTSFPTKELKDVLKKVDDLKQEIQVLEDQLNKDVSSFCILPPKPSHNVESRDGEVANVTEQLKELKKVNENSLSYLYISGNPGSGKSQLAGLVAKRCFDEFKGNPSATSFVMTVNAESPKALLESYVSFARLLKCPENTVSKTRFSGELNTDQKISDLRTLISTKIEHYTSWLLVVDNVTSISNVHVHLPERGSEQWSRGQLLITTQDTTSIPPTSSFLQHISVSKGLKPLDASSLLSMLSGFADSEMEQEVARALDYQPLALASATTYVQQVRQNKVTSNFGWKDYLKKLEKGQRGATESLLAETNPSYQKSMTKAITLAVEGVMASDRVIDHTFTLLSLCAQQPLSLEIVINYILNADEEIEDKEGIRTRIQRCSLLLFEEEESGVFIRVHQVVHDAINTVIKDLPEIQHIQAVNGAITSFNEFMKDDLSINSDEPDSPVNRKHTVPHLQALVIKIENLISKQIATQVAQNSVLNIQSYPKHFLKFANICEDDSEFYAAKKYYNLVLSIIERGDACSDRDLAIASVYFRLGNIHSRLGDLEEAIEYYFRALNIRLQKLGPDHVDVAAIYGSLGIVQRKLGDLKQDKEYCEKALAIFLKKLGPDHVGVARTYNNLADIHTGLGDLEQAKEYLDSALAIFLKQLGPASADVGRTYHNLGVYYILLGDLKKAKEYLCIARDIRLEKLGPEHVDVGRTYGKLGNVHKDLGDLEQAKKYYDHALSILLKKLGPEHVDVASTYNDLGGLHREMGDLQKAKEYHNHALAIQQKKLCPEHVDVAATYNLLGNVHLSLGDLENAKEHLDCALAIRFRKLGHEHADVAETYINLGVLQKELGDLEQAKDYCDRALAIYLKKLGPNHVNVATANNNLGFVHKELGNLEQAQECYERALAIRMEKLGPEHVGVSNVRRYLVELQQLMEIRQGLKRMSTS